jgi:hypothetical protein
MNETLLLRIVEALERLAPPATLAARLHNRGCFCVEFQSAHARFKC